MNFFENAIMRANMDEDIEITWNHDDDYRRIFVPVKYPRKELTARIDVSAVNNEFTRIRCEERQQIEAEIQNYLDDIFREEFEEELFRENNDESLLDFVIETRRNTAKSRKKDKKVLRRNRRILEEYLYCNTDDFRSRRVRANKARLSEIEGKKVWKKINHKIPRRNPDLAGKVGNKEYWMW